MPKSPASKSPTKSARKEKPTFLAVLCMGLVTLFALLALLEGVARLYQTRADQPIRSVGNFQAPFETKWFKLKDYVRQNGGVDVILMGNSMVNTGINPVVLVKGYEELTGNTLRVFNFGVEGMDITTNSELAQLLVSEYHPKAIIFFTEMREYAPQTDTTVPERYKTAAWFQYKLGNPTLEGWVYDHSAAMQYFLPYRNWSRADFPDTILEDTYRYNQTLPEGYEPDLAIGIDLDITPDPEDPEQKKLFDLYANYTPDEESLTALNNILNLRDQGVQVVVTEMPAYQSFYVYFGGESVHQVFVDTIRTLTEENGGVYVSSIDPDLIPMIGRVDNHHLNWQGTQVYSELLAAELGDFCLEQNLCLANEAAR